MGQELTCRRGTWTESDGPDGSNWYTYQWLRGGTPIGFATTSSYTVGSADRGSAMSCVVRASNGFGFADAWSASVTVPI